MKQIKSKMASLLLAFLAVLSLSAPALAAGNTLEGLTVTVKLVRPPKAPEAFKITLTADEDNAPMPEGAVNGVYTVTVYGAGEGTFPAITFPRVGIYRYTIRQMPGSGKKTQYDETVYHLTVYVTNAPGGGVEVTPVLMQEGAEEKSGEIIFTNIYPENRPDTPKTNDESNFPLYILMASASILVLVGLYLTRRREDRE